MADDKTSLVRDLLRAKHQEDIFSKWQLDGEEIIKKICTSFGWSVLIEEDKKTGNIIINASPIVPNPTMNRDGVLSISRKLYPIITRNTFLADLKVQEIQGKHGIGFYQAVSTLDDIAMNFDFYEFQSIATMTEAQIMIENIVQIALSRGREGTTLNYLKTVQQIKELISVSEQGNKGGFKK